MWIRSRPRWSRAAKPLRRNTTEEAAKDEYQKIADRRVRLGLVLVGDRRKEQDQRHDDEVSRAVIERARSMPGREKEVWDYYRQQRQCARPARAPIYEDKVVDFILELANVTEKKVTPARICSRTKILRRRPLSLWFWTRFLHANRFPRASVRGRLSARKRWYRFCVVNDEPGNRPGSGSPSLGGRSRISLNLAVAHGPWPVLSPGNWPISVSAVLVVLHHLG